jgi:recombination protein RecR
VEGDSTAFYIFRKLEPLAIQVTAISRGIGVGDQLEYADEVTLARSIQHRIPFEESLRR